MTVSTEEESLNSGSKVYVANYTTSFDHLAAHVVVSTVTVRILLFFTESYSFYVM